MDNALATKEVERYCRQLILPQWSARFQVHLRGLTVGVAAGYQVASLYLRAAGVGAVVEMGGAAAPGEEHAFDCFIAEGAVGIPPMARGVLVSSPSFGPSLGGGGEALVTVGYAEEFSVRNVPPCPSSIERSLYGTLAVHLLITAERARFVSEIKLLPKP